MVDVSVCDRANWCGPACFCFFGGFFGGGRNFGLSFFQSRLDQDGFAQFVRLPGLNERWAAPLAVLHWSLPARHIVGLHVTI